MYAKLEGKQESETQAIGCVSGLIPIIAVVKFLSYKEITKIEDVSEPAVKRPRVFLIPLFTFEMGVIVNHG